MNCDSTQNCKSKVVYKNLREIDYVDVWEVDQQENFGVHASRTNILVENHEDDNHMAIAGLKELPLSQYLHILRRVSS